MGRLPPKSVVRYAKTQNRLSPLWAPSDLGSQKRNTYATFFLTLHSLWAPSDFFFAQVPHVEVYRLRRHTLALPLSRWRSVVWGRDGTSLSRLSHDDGTFTKGKLPQIIY